MIDHFEIKTANLSQCIEFYSAVLKPLNIETKWSDTQAVGFGPMDEAPLTRYVNGVSQ